MTRNLTRSAVRIYAALTALGNGSQDVLTKLLPFLEHLMRRQNGRRFDPNALAESVRETYKWNFNADVVEAFVPRLTDAGWLTPVEVPNITSLTDEERFLCARFVQRELREGGSTSETLARIASIGLLTEVVQDFVRPTDAVKHTDLVVYLDSPIALEFLGVSGRAARENTVPLVRELQRIGAQVRIFAQSLDEMRAALSAVLQNPQPTGPTAQTLARGEVLREYVSQVANDPTQFLEDEGVAVYHRTLDQVPSEEKYFTLENRDAIIDAQAFQQSSSARYHDAYITTLVMRQRRGRTARDIFKSKFIVMTKNNSLAQVVRKSCIEMGLLGTSEIPPVVHRRVLSTAMWLRTGLGADDLEVPKRMLLAGCEQVLAVRKGVVDAVKKMTDALGDEEKSRQLDILIQKDRSAQMLMDKTLGAPSVVTEENLSFLFEEMLHPHLEQEREKGRQAVSAERAEARKTEKKLSEQLKTEQTRSLAARNEIDQARKEDEKAIAALCLDVEQNLGRKRRKRWFAAGVLALAFCALAAFSGNAWSIAISVVLNSFLALLSLTGINIIGVKTDSDKALGDLRITAEQRGLIAKLDRFSIEWDGKEFSRILKPEEQRDDLFGS